MDLRSVLTNTVNYHYERDSVIKIISIVTLCGGSLYIKII